MQTATARQNIRMSSGGIFPARGRSKSRRNARFSSISATSASTYTETSCIKDGVGIDPAADGVILSHKEGYTRGVASNHGDPEHLWTGLGLSYTMDTFRAAVKKTMGTDSVEASTSGSSSSGSSASGNSSTNISESSLPAVPFTVQVLVSDLNYCDQPSMSGTVKGQTGKGTFTITDVSGGWGKLKSGAGWIYLLNTSYCTVGSTTGTLRTPGTRWWIT